MFMIRFMFKISGWLGGWVGGEEQINLMKCQLKGKTLLRGQGADDVSLKRAVKVEKGTDENGKALISL